MHFRHPERLIISREAAVFATVVICAPISSFARYFMPESLYSFGFWWTIYLFLVTLRQSTLSAGLAAGVGPGLLSLVKPHALMLVVGIGLPAWDNKEIERESQPEFS